MPGVTTDIALLPLPAVLFPGTYLPLRIAEESHRSLLRDCVDEGRRLGVILNPGVLGPGHPAVPCTTGCLASVSLLFNEGDEDEPLSAVLYGEKRIRVMDYMQQDPYLTGQVEILEDSTGPQAGRRTREAGELFAQYLELIRKRYKAEVLDLTLPDDPTMASYMLASVLHLPLPAKQRWLESVSAAQRLQDEVGFLRAECEKLAIFLAIEENRAHKYQVPDPQVYADLISNN